MCKYFDGNKFFTQLHWVWSSFLQPGSPYTRATNAAGSLLSCL
ncbi:hypothetical protein PT7_1673 [Pusillimonas sp. T7-7]|nr:hypothetical protein PT7_1673 [Pusillimonas sp. T7-7]